MARIIFICAKSLHIHQNTKLHSMRHLVHKAHIFNRLIEFFTEYVSSKTVNNRKIDYNLHIYIYYLGAEEPETIITKSPSLNPRTLNFSPFLISFPLYNNCCCGNATCVCFRKNKQTSLIPTKHKPLKHTHTQLNLTSTSRRAFKFSTCLNKWAVFNQ